MTTSHHESTETNRLFASNEYQLAVHICMVFGLGLIAVALHFWGAREVRTEVNEVVFLTYLGGLWLAISGRIFSWLGLSVLHDAVERKNPAALVALCSALLAVACIYTGGSLGEGPSYWNNFFSAGLGTCAMLGLWLFLEISAHVSVPIAEERDLASGLRFAGYILAVSLVISRAVAGDWHSISGTVHDFVHDSWAALVLALLAIFTDRLLQPNSLRPNPNLLKFGLAPALSYLALAVIWLWHLGRWEGMPE